MEQFYVYTTNGRIFYTSIRLNDRFKEYQLSSPLGYSQEYHGYQYFAPVGQNSSSYFPNWAPKRPKNVMYGSRNRFEKAQVVWDSSFFEHSSVWTLCRESLNSTSDQLEPIIYKPADSIKKKNKKKRKRKTKKSVKKELTKEELDDELDHYMINIQ